MEDHNYVIIGINLYTQKERENPVNYISLDLCFVYSNHRIMGNKPSVFTNENVCK